jgi:hypothetical protein
MIAEGHAGVRILDSAGNEYDLEGLETTAGSSDDVRQVEAEGDDAPRSS